MWENPTKNIDLLQTFYFFNVTNPAEVVGQGAKPRVAKVGPFVYRERRPKFDINFTQSGDRVSFRYNRIFTYEANMSLPQSTAIMQFDQYILGVRTPIAMCSRWQRPPAPVPPLSLRCLLPAAACVFELCTTSTAVASARGRAVTC